MAQKRDRSQETTTAILQAAMRLSMIKEIDQITIRDICAEAEISVGAFYHHFASRQEMFLRVFEAFDRTFSQQMIHRSKTKEPQDALTDVLLFQARYMAQDGAGLIAHYYRTLLATPSDSAVSSDRTYYQAVHHCVQRLADAGRLYPDCQPKEITSLCLTFIRGCMIDWCLHKQSYDIVSHVRSILPIFLRGFVQNPD